MYPISGIVFLIEYYGMWYNLTYLESIRSWNVKTVNAILKNERNIWKNKIFHNFTYGDKSEL